MVDLLIVPRAVFRRARFPRAAVTPVALSLALAHLPACSRKAESPVTIRLIDAFDTKLVEGSSTEPAAPIQRAEWRFDGAPPSPAAPPPGPAGTPARPPALAETRGWEAGPGVSGLSIRDGKLVGHTTTDFPILRLERTTGLENADQLQAVEVRLRVSGGANLSLTTLASPTVDLDGQVAVAHTVPWLIKTPVIAGDQAQTYTMTPPAPVAGARIRHMLLRPTDAAGARFAIESVRLVFRREHLASVPSGVGWQGLRDVFRETLVTRTPETARFEVTLPSRPLLDMAIGTPEDQPITFSVAVRRGDKDAAVLTRTLTTPYRWERQAVDLKQFAGAKVTLSLSATSDTKAALALWGSPVVRQRVAAEGNAGGPPQTVILIQGDTLRTDHLDVYGYARPTAPTLRRLAQEGALFRHAITQTSWTKAATPSIMTSLYASTHGVHQIPDRLPASATTIAEVFREAGYATVSFASSAFTGQLTNLHQGFEELHESLSLAGRAGPRGTKTARELTDRLVEWLEARRDAPSFVYLHFFDPHSPYEPFPPYDTLWADPKGREEHLRQQEVVRKFIASAFLAGQGMATREEMVKAGLDSEAFIRFSKDWYDGSIRGMDAEIGRLVERLQALGLTDRTVIAFFADHGEEFHDHGRMWHGQSVYGEMVRVPLILWGPGRVPGGLKVEEPVSLIDVMPTLLEMSDLPVPSGVQGQSLRPLLAADGRQGAAVAGGGWKRRPVFAEKQPQGDTEHPLATECYAIIDGNWKLIHNVARAPVKPEFELFDFYKDPLDQKDVAADNREVVQRLARMLDGWRKMATSARLKADSEGTKGMSAEELERLRSLGYVK